jgi:hypothetical protein
VPPFDGTGVPHLGYIVQCVVVAMARLGIELAPSAKDLLAAHGMMPDVVVCTGPAFLHELVQLHAHDLLGQFMSMSSRGLVLKCGLNNWKWISSGRDPQRIGSRRSCGGSNQPTRSRVDRVGWV